MRSTSAAAAFLVLMALPAGPAQAHRFAVERSLMLEAWNDGSVHVVATIKVPGGKARDALKAIAPNDAAVKSVLIQRALNGVKLHIGKTQVTLQDVQSKLNLDADRSRPVRLMLYGKVLAPRTETSVAVSTAPGSEAIELRVLPGKRRFRAPSRGKQSGRGLDATLGQSDRIQWTLVALPKLGKKK